MSRAEFGDGEPLKDELCLAAFIDQSDLRRADLGQAGIARHRGRRGRVGAEAVNSFGRKGDEAAAAQDAGGRGDTGRVRPEKASVFFGRWGQGALSVRRSGLLMNETSDAPGPTGKQRMLRALERCIKTTNVCGRDL